MDQQSSNSGKITSYFTFKKTVEWMDVSIVQGKTITEHFYSDCISERVKCGCG